MSEAPAGDHVAGAGASPRVESTVVQVVIGLSRLRFVPSAHMGWPGKARVHRLITLESVPDRRRNRDRPLAQRRPNQSKPVTPWRLTELDSKCLVVAGWLVVPARLSWHLPVPDWLIPAPCGDHRSQFVTRRVDGVRL